MKKLLSMLIVTVMLLGMVPFAFATQTAPEQITLGKAVTVNVDRYNPESLFTYTVAEEGEYVFYSEGEDDTYGYVLDENSEVLDENDDYNTTNFTCILYLEKGEKITLRSRLYDVSRKGTYTVTFAKCSDATAIVLDKDEIVTYPGNSFYIDYTFAPVGAYEQEVTISSSDPTVVAPPQMDSNMYYASKVGTTTLTFTSENALTTSVDVTVKNPDVLTLDTPISATSKESYAGIRYNFTPSESGYYTYTVQSDEYVSIYATAPDEFFEGAYDYNPSFSVYMKAGTTYTLHVNNFSENQNYTVLVRESTPATEIYFEGGSDTQFIDFQDWLYVYGVDGEIAGDVEFSVSDPNFADIHVESNNCVSVIMRRAGKVTVIAKYNGATATREIEGVAIPTITYGTPYVEETIGMREAVVKFTPTTSGTYMVEATDELGINTAVDINGAVSETGVFEKYMYAGSTYTIRANRYFMGIGMGYDEYDYVGDITIDLSLLSKPEGMKFANPDPYTAYRGIDFDLTVLPTNENGAFTRDVEWTLSNDEDGFVQESYRNKANIVFYGTGKYTVTAKANGYTQSIEVNVVEPPKAVVGTEYNFTIAANSKKSFEFIPEKTGYYTTVINSDVKLTADLPEFMDSGNDMVMASAFVSDESNYINITNNNDTEANVTLLIRSTNFPTEMTADVSNLILEIGDAYYPDFYFNPNEVWENVESATSSDENVVEIEGYNEIIAVGEGTATVTYVSEYGLETKITVTVVDDLSAHQHIFDNDCDTTCDCGFVRDITHAFGDYIYNNDATTFADGTQTRTCAVCGLKETVTAPGTKLPEPEPHSHDSLTFVYDNNEVDGIGTESSYCEKCKKTIKRSKIVSLKSCQPITRAMVCVILADIFDYDESAINNDREINYTDVGDSDTFAPAIEWCVNAHILSGVSDNAFQPHSHVTREQLAVMLINAIKSKEIDLATGDYSFNDSEYVSKWAQSAVINCLFNNIMTTLDGGMFNPRETAVVADLANIFNVFPDTNIDKDVYSAISGSREHKFDNNCDTTCDCGYERITTHDYKDTYNAVSHFEECTICGYIGDGAPHQFDNACDTTCDCGFVRQTTHDYQPAHDAYSHFERCTGCRDIKNLTAHEYDNTCDPTCDCGFEREVSHNFKPSFDEKFHFDKCTGCGAVMNSDSHQFDNDCDATCDCGYTTTAMHTYYNPCDTKCAVCGAALIPGHQYDNACDDRCNICGKERTITHKYGEYVSDKNASQWSDGTKTRTCSVCGDKDTIIDKGTKLPPETSGSCGDNATWAFDKTTGKLTIDGWGAMEEYGSPWYILNDSVTSIVIGDKITSLSIWAFEGMYNLKDVKIGSSVTSIAYAAFFNCSSLTAVEIPESVIAIDERAFDYCSELETVTYGGTKEQSQKISIGANNDPLKNAVWTYKKASVEIKDTSKVFTDIKSKGWYKEYVDYSVAHGIFTGTSKNEFSPSMNITRAQFVQVLANLIGVDTSNRNVTTSFKDVPAKKWYTAAVKWASENKIVNGTGDGKFEPNANVTREQMCVMLVNFAKFKGITLKTVESKEDFADNANISKWAKTAVYTCQQADIVNGKGAGKFDPKGTGTRAEASVMFTKFHKDYLG